MRPGQIFFAVIISCWIAISMVELMYIKDDLDKLVANQPAGFILTIPGQR